MSRLALTVTPGEDARDTAPGSARRTAIEHGPDVRAQIIPAAGQGEENAVLKPSG
ncbi:MAG TPA: hypothetical protein VGS41_17080 [Chthonomonadales bacterium]|nr:hypothetical protein [Chthonomonadales bacterium]